MNTEDHLLAVIRQEIIKNHLLVTAIIQDIQQCTGPLELLKDLNADGRTRIADLRNSIDKLVQLAETEINVKKKTELMQEVEKRKSQLVFALAAFKKANIVGACVIDKMAKDELMSTSEEQQRMLRKRRDKRGLADTASLATDRLLSISRTLAETSQRSADTLDTLLISSDKVNGTKDELEQQQQAIILSGKLLGKYGRREVTDKALLTLAFIFFLACVAYVLQKRLW
ncbi:vesicle transport protein Sec20 [Cotesia typhae]|uniref:vesicle transport protein Sec20 n=1 Tax=Cotesia typhae TaxID=2053667 RepID=UPI003D6894DD